jgi:hypothetical protein
MRRHSWRLDVVGSVAMVRRNGERCRLEEGMTWWRLKGAQGTTIKSASRPLVDFGVLNDNLIK